jgi:hypothetical protein
VKCVASFKIFNLQIPYTLGFIPPCLHDLVAELDVSVELIFLGDMTEILQDFWGRGIAVGRELASQAPIIQCVISYKWFHSAFGSHVNW